MGRPRAQRAAELYERIFLGYGDDSVAQLGGAHVACEWVSNILTKLLQRPRLAAYLEQSTRYIAYDAPMPGGGYRYYRDAELGPEYEAAMDALFATYAEALPVVRGWVEETFPRHEGESPRARERAIAAKALDLLRGLLPAASLSHMGIYASGQAYEQLILHLIGHPLPEARRYGELILEAIKAVMPSFVMRVERPERGGAWVAHLEQRRAAAERWTARLGLDRSEGEDDGPSVRLLGVDGDEDGLLAALLFESAGVSEQATRGRSRSCRRSSARPCWATSSASAPTAGTARAAGSRRCATASRSCPTTAPSATCSATGCSPCSGRRSLPDLGAGIPDEVAAAGAGDAYARALERSRAEYERLVGAGLATAAPYALCLGYRIRYVLDLNAREAMHLIELRSGREGHPSYRAVAHELHRQIATIHPAVAAAMTHVDTSTEPRLERILSEMRQQAKAAAATGG